MVLQAACRQTMCATTSQPIWAEDATVNIDVEGRVRDPETDALLLDSVVAYASRALTLGVEIDGETHSATPRLT